MAVKQSGRLEKRSMTPGGTSAPQVLRTNWNHTSRSIGLIMSFLVSLLALFECEQGLTNEKKNV